MATDSRSVAKLREELDALGGRRAQQEQDDEKLAKDIKAVLRRARGKLSMQEVADRLGVHRTTLYRVYQPHDD